MKKRTYILIVLSIVYFFQVITITYSLSFTDLLDNLPNTYDVVISELDKSAAEKNVIAAQNPGDLYFSLSPTVKATTLMDSSFADQWKIYGSSTLKIPIGLTDAGKEKLASARYSVELALAGVNIAQRKSFVNLFTLYQSAWLAQEEEPVAEMEIQAAETRVNLLTEQYKSGLVPVSMLYAAEQDLQNVEEAFNQVLLDGKLARYELSFLTGLSMEDTALEKYDSNLDSLPLPPALSSWANENHPDILEQEVKIKELDITVERMKKSDFSFGIKPFFSLEDHSFSLDYEFSNPSLTAAYSFPLTTIGVLPSSSNSTGNISTWDAGFTVNLSLSSGKSDLDTVKVYEVMIAKEKLRLSYIKDLVSLQIRTGYQQYLKAKDAYEQAKRDLERIQDNKEIIATKNSLGQVSSAELLGVEALVARGIWRVESAKINIAKAYFSTALSAAWGEF